MKDKLREKYVPVSFSAWFMDEWLHYTQGNKSAKKYVAKFDEFLADVISFILKHKLKSFPDLELDLEATCELNF